MDADTSRMEWEMNLEFIHLFFIGWLILSTLHYAFVMIMLAEINEKLK